MQLYFYSCQDLIIHSPRTTTIKAGKVYQIKLDKDENVVIYYAHNAGVIYLNWDIILQRQHSQINFHSLGQNAVLCEIKPITTSGEILNYTVGKSHFKLINQPNSTHIYFNENYCGTIMQRCENIEHINSDKTGQQYELVKLNGNKKYIALFDAENVVYCGQYVDIEFNNNYVQIYTHIDNVFNVGSLIKYVSGQDIKVRTVKDCGEENKLISNEFIAVYFLEALKCGRVKYAYNHLSHELKSAINIDVLTKYFSQFDEYFYLHEQGCYITLKNNKVIGIYHFVVKDNLIDNIY